MNTRRIIFLLMLISPLSSFAGTYQGGLLVDRLWIASDKVIFGFTTQPVDCIDVQGYYWTHAYIDQSNPLFKEQLSLLLLARAAGKKVDIWYADQGDCKTIPGLLSVDVVGIAQGG